MSIYRPGGLELTEYILKAAGVEPGSRLLDAGCGDGTAAEFIRDKFNIDVEAIDINPDAVAEAAKKGVNARVMDASALEYDIYEFDTVLMECVFSVLERQEEAVHEAYCVLKKGGNLIITDVYNRNPDMERFEKDYRVSMALFRKPRVHEDCGKREHIPSPYCQDGGIVISSLQALLDELGMKTVLFEDRTEDMIKYAAEGIMKYGSLEKWIAEAGICVPDCFKNGDGQALKKQGYFVLIAHKD